MEICTGGSGPRWSHDGIVHDGGDCPLCASKEEIDELKGKIEDLEVTIEELQRGGVGWQKTRTRVSPNIHTPTRR